MNCVINWMPEPVVQPDAELIGLLAKVGYNLATAPLANKNMVYVTCEGKDS